MKEFHEIDAEKLSISPFELIGKEWMLITAGNSMKVNTMTASWGGLGVMWGKPVVFVAIRPQRYTKVFVDANTTFSLSFFGTQFRQELAYLGKASGREEDKISKANLTIRWYGTTPFFDEARLVCICEKMYATPLKKENFNKEATFETWYPKEDYHTLYIATISHMLKQ